MNLPQIFMYQGAQVRTVTKNGDTYFVLKDLCEALGDLAPNVVRQRLNDDVCSTYPIPDALGRMQDTTIVNEDGMYDVVLESRKSEARAFRKWVTSEVLPSIRKTGTYGVHQLPQTFAEALRLAADLSEKTVALEAKIESDKPLVHFAESLQISQDSILVADMAKLLKQNGIDMGEHRLFRWLRENGYLIKSGSEYNMPTQRSMELKLFEVKTGTRNGSEGVVRITRTTKVTGKGQIYFLNKFKPAA